MKLLYLLIFCVVNVHARPTPPAPPQQNPLGGTDVPTPPSGPIDDQIIILLIVALVYGIYVVYCKRKEATI